MTTQIIVDGVTLSAASWANDVDTATYNALTGVAGTNTITATGPANFTYATGAIVRFIPAATNTGATTINITPSGSSALGAKSVFWSASACGGGELKIGVPTIAIYDGTQFQLVGPAAITGTWTPVDLSGGTTISSVEGTYTKIGNRVMADCSFTVDSNSNGAPLNIGGLPYTAASGTSVSGGYITYTDQGTNFIPYINAGTTNFNLRSNAGAALTNIAFSTKIVRLHLDYRV